MEAAYVRYTAIVHSPDLQAMRRGFLSFDLGGGGADGGEGILRRVGTSVIFLITLAWLENDDGSDEEI
ncbi:hypothetical protein AXG93_3507s1060 [Marchantia polymorpha subsp. ruderalis]|uniref:Uncharacterized protein n=1 Tax=Marchantia polymorpha subsp. ruderalis TaxID=1480154 RepID=A0A176VH44_MARPO|nr:hypothetical protein AXG93_3507s1060 [Marchantia polymorpha subsp. ruderalis]